MKNIIYITLFSVIISACKKEEINPEINFDERVVPYKIIDETFRVGSRISLVGNNNRVVRSITLPRRSLYWCYWVGVGEGPVSDLAKIVLPAAAAKYTSDPVVAYGWKFISILNAINATGGNVDLFYCDKQNKNLFMSGDNTFAPYPFFQCPQTITSYAIRETMDAPILRDSTFYATFYNDHPTSGEDVTFKVWAYIIKE
jgi:hypothetical protein